MGILTDAFIATDAEVAAADFANKSPSELFPTVEAKRVDTVKLGKLEAIMAGANPVTIDQQDPQEFVIKLEREFPFIRDIGVELGEGETSDGPWVCRFSDPMVGRLAELSPTEVTRYGQAWAATEEWQAYGVLSSNAISSIVEYLRELSQLAKRAQAEDKNVYMWICL